MTSHVARLDFQPSEVAVSALFGVAVLVGSGVALSVAALERPGLAPEIEKGTAIPVKIVPVLDMDAPLLKLGGAPNRYKLPDRWVKQTLKPRVEQKAFVSTKASKREHDIPPHDVPLAPASVKPPPSNAEIAKQVDTPVAAVVDAGPVANVSEVGHADGVREGTETDPLKGRAVDLYRAKIAAWFSGRFRVSGSGLPKAELTKYRVGAEVSVAADHTVIGYTLVPSGNAAFDAAARATLEGAKGQQLPPPPENYPDVAQREIHITFVCRENRCD
jgi:hypothetical protein